VGKYRIRRLGQPAERLIKVSVTPTAPTGCTRTAKKVRFLVSVTQSGAPVPGAQVHYAVMPEKMKPVQSGALKLDNGRATIEGGTLKTAGFLRCEVYVQADGKEYKGLGTAAFQPNDIGPVATLPGDFLDFWNGAKAELAKVPLDARMTLLPERCTGKGERVPRQHPELQKRPALRHPVRA
jgi:hypothetical protein